MQIVVDTDWHQEDEVVSQQFCTALVPVSALKQYMVAVLATDLSDNSTSYLGLDFSLLAHKEHPHSKY